MIVDHIRNRALYYGLGTEIQKTLDYFAGVSGEPFDKADITVPGTTVLVKCRPMYTKPLGACAFEAHRRYADIHFVAYGSECIGYANVRDLKEITYDADKDVVALEGTGTVIPVPAGYFMITMPEDAHMPCICGELPAPLGKMIAKIPVCANILQTTLSDENK